MSDKEVLAASYIRSAADLAHQHAKTEALFQSLGDGAIATDQEGRIQQVNQAASHLLGYTKKEIIGQWFPKAIPAYDETGMLINTINRPIIQAILTGKPVTRKAYYLTKAGKLLAVMITVSPIVLNKRPLGAVEVFRDITQESEIDKMKSEFISIASHQLRTPLTSIKTYAHLLSDGYRGKLTPDQDKFMQVILTSIDRMNDLIDILLNISRIEAGKLDIVHKDTDLKRLVLAVMQELRTQAAIKHIDVKLKYNVKSKIAAIDQVLTTEVLSNLLSNAIKYTPVKGEVIIQVKENKKEFVISVRDNGYGIPKADQDRIFSKFFRADNAKQKDPSGTGLGLYMVKKIIDSMGGRIWFESKKNQGSVFYATVPKVVKENATYHI